MNNVRRLPTGSLNTWWTNSAQVSGSEDSVVRIEQPMSVGSRSIWNNSVCTRSQLVFFWKWTLAAYVLVRLDGVFCPWLQKNRSHVEPKLKNWKWALVAYVLVRLDHVFWPWLQKSRSPVETKLFCFGKLDSGGLCVSQSWSCVLPLVTEEPIACWNKIIKSLSPFSHFPFCAFS